ncbi:MAG: hypothetical protein QM687_11890 [Ferruginibacter sp.]
MILRTARHTSRLKAITRFYIEIIGLSILGEFSNHDGYDGVFLGLPGSSWHLEFTSSASAAIEAFNEDDLLVFYPETQQAYDQMLANIQAHNIKTFQAKNPYWSRNGVLVNDPDGYGVIICPLKIK